MTKYLYAAFGVAVLIFLFVVAFNIIGPGALERKFTLGGIYATCKPHGYDVVCFGDKAGTDGGVSCVPLSLAGGECRGL